MPYSTDTVRQYGDQALQSGGIMQMLTLANQYGIPLNQLAEAYGMDLQGGVRTLNDQGYSVGPRANGGIRATQIGSTTPTFTTGEEDRARGYINDNIWSGDLTGYNGGSERINDRILGEMLATGHNLGDVRELAPQFSEGEIDNYFNTHREGINAQRDDYLRFHTPGGNVSDNQHPNGVYAGDYNPNWRPGMPTGANGAPLDPMVAAMIQQANDNLFDVQLPGIQGAATGAGGLGGTRQGVAQGAAIAGTNKGLASAMANMYLQQYNSDANRSLSRYQGDQNTETSRRGQDYGFYSNERRTDLDSYRLGADLYTAGNAGYLGQGAGLTDLGTQQQNAAWDPINRANNVYSTYTGLGPSSTQSSSGGGGMGIFGGALAGYQMYRGNRGNNGGAGGGWGGGTFSSNIDPRFDMTGEFWNPLW